MHIDVNMVSDTLQKKFPVASMMVEEDEKAKLFIVFVLPELATEVNDYLKQIIFKKAFGPESYEILKENITGNGWVHTDNVHDPVSTVDWEYQDFEITPSSGYSCGTWGRPKSLSALPKSL